MAFRQRPVKLGTRRAGCATVSASAPGPQEQRSISADVLRNLVKGEGEASLSLPAPRRRPHAVTLQQREESGSAVPDSAGTFPWLRAWRGGQICSRLPASRWGCPWPSLCKWLLQAWRERGYLC